MRPFIATVGVIVGVLLLFFVFKERVSPDVRLVKEITTSTAKQLKDQQSLYLVGTGSQMMHGIEMLMMAFHFYETVDIKTARELLVESVEQYLFAINSNEKIRPYLRPYPFTAENVEIVIYFYSAKGVRVDSGEISTAAVNRGKMIYYMQDPADHHLKTIEEEPYPGIPKQK